MAWTATNTTCRCAVGEASALAGASFTSSWMVVVEAFVAIATTNIFSAANLLRSVMIYIVLGSFMALSGIFAYFGARFDKRDSAAVEEAALEGGVPENRFRRTRGARGEGGVEANRCGASDRAPITTMVSATI